MTNVAGCVFCKIVTGEIPSYKIHESEDCVAFLDISPLAEGHTLLVPKKHYGKVEQMPAEEMATVFRHVPGLVSAIAEATQAAGCNVLINNGSVAGQVVEHVHVHLIPRNRGDALGYRWAAGTLEPAQAQDLQVRITTVMQTG